MSRLRIKCERESPSMLPCWQEVSLTLVDDDGSETPITNVMGITWRAAAGAEPASATLEFIDVDVDVEVGTTFRGFSVDVGGALTGPAVVGALAITSAAEALVNAVESSDYRLTTRLLAEKVDAIKAALKAGEGSS